MKPVLYILTIVVFITAQINGQVTGLAVTGGGNFANLKAPESGTYDSETNTGKGGGLRFDFNLSDHNFMFSPELFIMEKGSDQFVQDFNDLELGKIDFTYLGVYLPLSFYIPIEEEYAQSYHGLFFQSKFYADYAVRGEQQLNGLRSDLQFDSTGDKMDFGYALEGGIVYNGLQIMLGYNRGIKNINFETESSSGVELISARNNGLYISVGYAAMLDEGY